MRDGSHGADSPYRTFARYFTEREDKVVKIPNSRMPVWKSARSAMAPRRYGVTPTPKIMPAAIVIPVVILLSLGEVSFEIAARATGKNPRITVAWKNRIPTRRWSGRAAAIPIVDKPVKNSVQKSIGLMPRRSTRKPATTDMTIPPNRESPKTVLAKSKDTALSFTRKRGMME